jgi:hypothetical protein
MRKALVAAAIAAAIASPSFAAQILLTSANVIGSSGEYDSRFVATNIVDNQTGVVTEPTQSGYWLNPDNGPANAYITLDLLTAQIIGSFQLFDTHNSTYNDRGTGNFSIIGSNAISGNTLVGAVTLVSGTLTAVSSSNDPITGQTFTVAAPGSYRYLQFLPTSVAASGSACCGANVYGLNELRVFDAPAAVPEMASWAMMVSGFGVLGGALRRRRTGVRFA